MRTSQSVFLGENAVRDYLNPDYAQETPLVELPKALNPFADKGVSILAKCAFLNPLLHVKWYVTYNMLLEAAEAGQLKAGDKIVENSSGNTASALAVLARAFGAGHLQAILPADIPAGKQDILRVMGAEPVLHIKEPGGPTGIERSRQLGARPGMFNPSQYDNPANPRGAEKWLGPEIWKQTDGRLSVFCAALGTTGTIIGTAAYLRRATDSHRLPRIVGVACAPGNAVPGARSFERLKEVGFDWRGALDNYVEGETRESFLWSATLTAIGILGGPTSGLALAGLIRFLGKVVDDGALDQIRNEDGKVVAVFLCPDTPLLYLDKYSTHLDPEDFQALRALSI
ncbi:MAG: pyridoxal-phosphate dependent enzyme [Patescibacteria group bacterium]|nr:pyridoxal-phosphate dependent enzyme [Patescibacteria group bacterium]MDE2116529.1 pyridoxal-phosphate dependent enzyme [Patescibacteria group bacterium]